MNDNRIKNYILTNTQTETIKNVQIIQETGQVVKVKVVNS